MATAELFNSSHNMLKAGSDLAVAREEESVLGAFAEIISGGGIAARFVGAGGRAVQAVPAIVKADQLDIMPFMSVTCVAGEWQDAMWWMRKDSFV